MALKTTFLDFEQPVAVLEEKIEELRFAQDDSAVDISEEISRLQKKSDALTKDLYAKLTPWQVALVARHAQRPYTLDYVRDIFTDFHELHGDRSFADDLSIVGGMARFNGQACMIIGHQKGRDTKERAARNFGMPKPEGYRKAQRLFQHAEKFGFPLICFIDTPGADPGIESEERGQGNAIAESILMMAGLKTPIVAIVIGEGGSGGALAIGVADRLIMLENSIYSVASPEGTAAILWRDSAKAPEAARAMKITAQDLLALEIIDAIVPEPEGGAHTDSAAIIAAAGEVIRSQLAPLLQLDLGTLLDQRYAKYRAIGHYQHRQSQILEHTNGDGGPSFAISFT